MDASNQKKVIDDPLIKFGSSIMGFREITRFAIYLYIVLTIFSIPMLYIYYNGTSSEHNAILKDSIFGNYTLGNLGQDSMQCKFISQRTKYANLACPYG